jgi:hypothetical protein
VAFRRTESIRSKMYFNDMILEEINTLNYLGCDTPYEGGENLDIEIVNFVKEIIIMKPDPQITISF